jgi:hypothetical protein
MANLSRDFHHNIEIPGNSRSSGRLSIASREDGLRDETVDSTGMMNLLFSEIFIPDFTDFRGFGSELHFEEESLGYHF